MNAKEFCDKAGADKNDRFVIEKIYKSEDFSFDKWVKKISKDFRSLKDKVFKTEEPKQPTEQEYKGKNKQQNKKA